MDIMWLFGFMSGILLGTFVAYLLLRNRKIVAEFNQMHDNIVAKHQRLIDILAAWQKHITKL